MKINGCEAGKKIDHSINFPVNACSGRFGICVFISSMSHNLHIIYFHTLQYEVPCMYPCVAVGPSVHMYSCTGMYVCKLEALNEKFTHASGPALVI